MIFDPDIMLAKDAANKLTGIIKDCSLESKFSLPNIDALPDEEKKKILDFYANNTLKTPNDVVEFLERELIYRKS